MADQVVKSGSQAPELPPDQQFVHLHLHTEYSLLDGGNRIDRLIARVAQLGMKAVGVTDHGNLFGAVSFYLTCKEVGVKPILGVEAYVTPPDKPRTDRTYSGGGEGGYHLVLLAMDLTGWQNLLVLCSEAYLTGFYYKPRIDRQLLEKHSAGLIAINGHLGSEIGEHLLEYARTGDKKHWERAAESAAWHDRVFNRSGDGVAKSLPRFYIELQHHVPEQNRINPLLVKLARELKLPIVCDNDAHFLKGEDHDAHDTLICISTGKNKDDRDRMRYSTELYVKGPREMRALVDEETDEVRAAWREGCENTLRIAEACNLELPIGRSHAPMVRVDVPEARSLPRWDDPAYAGDLTAWYKDYCSRFQVRPFKQEPTGAEMALAKSECDQALRLIAEAGVIWRYGPERDGAKTGSNPNRADVLARLERELKILADKNISAYFLIVWDFVNWGRQRGIPALARGSGVGTMVGYVMGLSNACPVKYGLLFERFTDPDRSEYPDIDIDLCQDGRADVINYVREKYGHVAQIITFGTLKARAAIRDVARVLGLSLPATDRIAKLVPEQLNITLDDALAQEPDFKGIYEGKSASLAKINDKLGPGQQADPDQVRRLIDNARTLEGQARHASVHAAGVIVATRPLLEVVPLYKQSGAEDHEIVTQWDGPTCEKMGLLKMDFLGLRTLSVIERAKLLIRATLTEEDIWKAVGREKDHEETKRPRDQETKSGKKNHSVSASLRLSVSHPLDLDRLSYDDQLVFEMFRRGDTTGVFQFESGGMRRLLVEMKPDRLEDLIAANALFRPGPMDLIPDYNRRKHGADEVPRVHEIVDRYTAETYGVMVYQEQVMQIVHGLGGITLRDAYSLIKNISKKKHDKIEKERPKFIEGAQKKGLTKTQAQDLFELILKFAGYGFNKSHSTGYAIVAYQTAYLKTYFPNQYLAAFLNYESQASAVSDWTPYLEDCRRARFVEPGTSRVVKTGVEVRPPDINLSQADFSVVFDEHETIGAALRAHQGHIRFGLKAIKGAGEKAIEEIIEERSDGVTELRSDEGKATPAQAIGSELRHRVAASPRHFTSLFDFCERVLARGPGIVNKATIESLIKCGAFDSLHGRENRAGLAASIEQAVSAGQKAAADRASGQGALFGFSEPPAPAGGQPSTTEQPTPSINALLAKVTPWNETETLAKEKEALGFYVSSHPLERWKSWSGVFATHNIAAAKDLVQDSRVVIPAMVQSVRALVVKTGRSAGQKMGIVTLEDLTGSMDSVMFSDCFARFAHLAVPEGVVFVLGRLDRSRGDPQVMIERLVPIEGVPLQPGRLRLILDEDRLNGGGPEALLRAAQIVRGGDGAAAVNASAMTTNGAGSYGPGTNGHANGNGFTNGVGHAGALNGAASNGAAGNGAAANGNGRGSPAIRVGPLAATEPDTPFPVEVVVATTTHAAVLMADPRLRVALKPDLVKDLETALGPGMVKLVAGVWVEVNGNGNGNRPWQKRRGGDED